MTCCEKNSAAWKPPAEGFLQGQHVGIVEHHNRLDLQQLTTARSAQIHSLQCSRSS